MVLTRLPNLDSLAADIRFAARGLRRAPGFTAAIVLMLGTGMAATVASFSVLNATVFRPAYPGMSEPERLVDVWISRRTADSPYGTQATTHEDYLALQRGLPALSGLTAYTSTRVAVIVEGEPAAFDGAVVSDNYFATLGISFAHGNGFSRSLDGRPPEVVISHDLWQRHLRGDSAIGWEVVVNDTPVRVVGVLPPGQPRGPDIWIPFSLADLALRRPDGRPASVDTIPARHFAYRGRLATGATVEFARAQAAAVASAIESTEPGGHEVSAGVNPLRSRSVTQTATRTASLLAVPIIVLAIACLNAANLLLARSARRGREWATRMAVGASKPRLIRFVLVEGLLLASAAAGLGLLSSPAILAVVEHYLPGTMLTIDTSVVLWTIALTLATSLAFGLGPAVRAAAVAGAGGPLHVGRSQTKTGWVLVSAQVTLSLALLSVGLQFVNAIRDSQGSIAFHDADRVLVASFDLGPVGSVNAAVDEFYRQLLDRTVVLPEVEAVALTNQPMRGGIPRDMIARAWVEDTQETAGRPVVAMHLEGDTAPAALDLRLERGRWFHIGDRSTPPQSIIVNRAMEDQVFGGHAIGRTLEIAAIDGTARYPVTVIGVIATSHGRPGTGPAILLPSSLTSDRRRTLWLRPRSGHRIEATALQSVVRAVDSRVPIDEVTTAAMHLSPYDANETGSVAAIIVLGVVALVLSAAGLYGLLAYLVSLRAKEFSIRVALGAHPTSVLRLSVRQAGVSVGIGLACGMAIAMTAGVILQSAIYGSRPVDLLAVAGSSCLLVVVMMLATAAPARRAANSNPMIALRHD